MIRFLPKFTLNGNALHIFCICKCLNNPLTTSLFSLGILCEPVEVPIIEFILADCLRSSSPQRHDRLNHCRSIQSSHPQFCLSLANNKTPPPFVEVRYEVKLIRIKVT